MSDDDRSGNPRRRINLESAVATDMQAPAHSAATGDRQAAAVHLNIAAHRAAVKHETAALDHHVAADDAMAEDIGLAAGNGQIADDVHGYRHAHSCLRVPLNVGGREGHG